MAAAEVEGCEGEKQASSPKMDWDINDNHFPKLQQVKNYPKQGP